MTAGLLVHTHPIPLQTATMITLTPSRQRIETSTGANYISVNLYLTPVKLGYIRLNGSDTQSVMMGFRLAPGLLTVVLVMFSLAAQAARIYVYQHSNGSRLITDHPRSESGYQLLKVYGIDESGWATRAPASRRLRPVRSKYDPLIHTTATRFGVDAALVKAVVHVESGFDPYAVSAKGASGLMQLMPGTASRYGVNSVFDPRENVAAGVRYLRDLLSEFDGDTRLALAGYNAGENVVAKYRGVPPYPETRGYITRVLSLYQQYRSSPLTGRK